ncbi:MAG: DinB family protein [Bacteroidota bacterium]
MFPKLVLNVHNPQLPFMVDLEEEYTELVYLLEQCASLIEHEAALYSAQPAVSKWSPAQHVHHVLKANGMMLKAVAVLCQRPPTTPSDAGLTPAGRAVLHQGMVRGAGRSPDNLVPPETPDQAELRVVYRRSLLRTERTQPLLHAIPLAQARLPHPYFGHMSASEWLRFTRIHVAHHLSIIEEILAHANQDTALSP